MRLAKTDIIDANSSQPITHQSNLAAFHAILEAMG